MLTPRPSHCATMEDTMEDLGSYFGIEIFMEEGIAGDKGILPRTDITAAAPKIVLKKMLKKYSYAILFDNDQISKVWVYKNGTGSFIRMSGPKEAYRQSSQDIQASTLALKNTGTINSAPKTGASGFIARDKGVTRTRSGMYYRKNSFGYKQPVFSPISIKNNPSWTQSGTYKAFKENKQKAEQDKLMSQAAMMRHLKMDAYSRGNSS